MKTTKTPDQQPSELDALEAQAQAMEQDAARAAEQPTPQEVEQAANARDDLLDTLKILRSMGGPLCHWMTAEKFAATWNDQRLKDIAEAGAAIMERHGWTVSALMGTYAPYIALIAAMGAPTLETVRAYKEAKYVQKAQPVGADDGNTDRD